MNKILGLKRLDTNNTGYNGFEYPDVGGTVVCPDWKPEATCENGLFFITEDACAFDLSGREGDWIVAELENVVVVDGKVKCRVAKIIHRSSNKYAPVEYMPIGFVEEWVKQNGNNIQFIKNPSIEMQKIAVAQNGYTIMFIKNPSEEVQKIAVAQNGYAIYHIDNPSEEVQRIAVEQDWRTIQYIKNPSIEVQKIANMHKKR